MRPPGRADLRGGGGGTRKPSRFTVQALAKTAATARSHSTSYLNTLRGASKRVSLISWKTGMVSQPRAEHRRSAARSKSRRPSGLVYSDGRRRSIGRRARSHPTADHTLRAWAARKASSTIARSPSSTAATAPARPRGSSPRRILVRASESPQMRSKAGTSSRNS